MENEKQPIEQCVVTIEEIKKRMNGLSCTNGESMGKDTHTQKKVNGSFNHVHACEHKPEGKVLVLYTGGTIGMMRNDNGGI